MKLRVNWEPNLIQDLNAINDPKSPFYDEVMHTKIIDCFESVVNYINSDEFKKILTNVNEENRT